MLIRTLFIFFFWLELNAQTFNAAPFQGMGNTGLASESIYSITSNAAGLGNLMNTTIAIAYQPHFMTSELRTQATYIAIPARKVGAFGLGIRNYGIPQVSSFLTSNLVYARSFGGVLSTSFSANYHWYHVENYVNDNVLSLDLGALVKFGEQVNIGFIFRNATFSTFKDDTEQYLPVEFGAGFLYKLSRDLSLASVFYYEYEQGINIRGGLAYSALKFYNIRSEGAIARIKDRSVVLYSTLDTLQHGTLQYSVLPDLREYATDEHIQFCHIKNEDRQNRIIEIDGVKILYLEKLMKDLPMEIDYVLWRKNNYTDLDKLLNINPRATIILDGSNSDKTIERLKNMVESNSDRLYILKNNFAYVWHEE